MNDITKRTIELISNIESKEKCYIETSKDNKLITKIDKDGKLRYIGSKYSVERDIEKFYADVLEGAISETIFLIFGLGAGEHIKYLFDRITNSNKILIIEPSAAVIKEVLQENYLNYILQDERIGLCYFDYGIRKNLKEFIGEQSIDNTKFVAFSNYNSIFEEEYKTAFSEFKNIKEIKDDTLNVFAHKFFNNFIENIFSLDEFYTINQLKNLYKGKPAVIVSAGPSLNKNIHLLKDVQDKFIIICGPRTIGTLINNGIKPDFLCSVDPQDEAYELMKDYIDSEVPLVFMDSASDEIVKKHKGVKVIAANQGMENYLEEMLGIKVDSLMQGGSVAHFCMGLAVYMGCSNVIFIGQDLAYTNEKFQAEGTYSESGIDEIKYKYEENKEEWDKDKSYSIYVSDIYGQMVRTSKVLNSYRKEFEDLIYSCNGVEFINSSEGGANINGTKVMDLKDSITMYAKENIKKNIEELLGDKIVLEEDSFSENMFKVIDKLQSIKKACEEGLDYSDKMLYFYKDNKYCDMNKVFNKLDKIDAIINDKKKLGFIAYKAVALISDILENDYYKEKANETEKELGIRLAKRSFGMYLAVLQTVEDAIFRIKDKVTDIKIDYEKDLDWEEMKKQDIRCIFNENKRIEVLYKCIKKYDVKSANVVVGDYNYDNGYLNIYSKKYAMKELISNLGIVLYKNVVVEENILYIKCSMPIDAYIYFHFCNDEQVEFYENVKLNKDIYGNYDYENDRGYQIYIGFGHIGVLLNNFGAIYRNNIREIKNKDKYQYEIIFNLEDGYVLVNDELVKISRFFKNSILGRRLGIVVSSAEEKYKLEIEKLEIGKKVEELYLKK